MKKVLVLFRGLNMRYRRPEHLGMGTPFMKSDGSMHFINPLLGVDNWKESIFDDLSSNNIEYDIAFVTYKSEVLDELIDRVKPKYVITGDYNNQVSCLRAATDFIDKVKGEYDRIVVLRFDFQYRLKITNWPKWEDKGIFLVNRDVTWDTTKYYADILFMFDSEYFNEWKTSVDNIRDFPHDIGKFLYEHKIDINLMYDGYYNMVDHPLHSYISWEERPDLNIEYTPIKIK